MISYPVYKVIHILGNMLLIMALGGLTLHAANGGTRETNRGRKLAAITHGIGMVIILVAGFGLLARIGITHGAGWPGWVWAKLGIWLVLGGIVALIGRKPELARVWWFLVPLLGATAAWLALTKPF